LPFKQINTISRHPGIPGVARRAAATMKLINVSIYELLDTNFTPGGPSNKPYAILSHTCREDEVTYADMQPPLPSRSVGGRKSSTSVTRRSGGLQWAWVDTCCINKSQF
jgi:hypothetical protein